MNTRSHLVLLALVLLQLGCVGSPTRPSEFYVLSAEPAPALAGLSPSARPLAVGLGPLALPDLFDRPQIVTRPAANRVDLAEFDRWGGDLNRDLGRVLAQNLMARLNTDAVLLFPWSANRELDFQVTVQFFRFDGQLGKSARLEGVWRLLDGRQGCELSGHRFQIEESPDGSDYGALVGAMSRGVARLSDDIAAKLAQSEPGC